MGLKAAETTPNINNTFGPKTANNCVYVCSDGSRSLAKEMRALKISVVAGQRKVTMKNWEQSLKLILLKLHEKLPKNLKKTILWSFDIWSELERWKDSISGCLMSRQQKKKKNHFEVSSSLILCKTKKHFLIRLGSALTSGFYTTDDDQFSGSTEKLQSTSQIQTCTKIKVMVIVWWSAAHLAHYNFLNSGETIISEKYAQQINEMHWKLQCLQTTMVNR